MASSPLRNGWVITQIGKGIEALIDGNSIHSTNITLSRAAGVIKVCLFEELLQPGRFVCNIIKSRETCQSKVYTADPMRKAKNHHNVLSKSHSADVHMHHELAGSEEKMELPEPAHKHGLFVKLL